MNIAIDTDVLRREHLSLGEFLVLLMGCHDISYRESLDRLVSSGMVQPNVFDRESMVLSDNTKNYVARVLLESDPRVRDSGIDFALLAQQLQSTYPTGKKPGTSYCWGGKTSEIAQKLMTLVSEYNFSFTEQEALAATREYVSSFGDDKSKMRLLKYFILRTTNDGSNRDIDSPFMTIIENNR